MAECSRLLHHTFQNQELLRLALTHASSAVSRLESNERLEFLGDAILALVVCEELFKNHPGLREGDLTEIKSAVVSRRCLARVTVSLGLSSVLRLGKGVRRHVRLPRSILANAYEAVVAALYLDGGLGVAQTFVRRTLGPEIEHAIAQAGAENYKSVLQQREQQDGRPPPVYAVVDESGPDHRKVFRVSVAIDDRVLACGTGQNKRAAEQAAARAALECKPAGGQESDPGDEGPPADRPTTRD